MTAEMWTSPMSLGEPFDVDGFRVETIDGEIGTIRFVALDVGSAYLIVDTAPWFGGAVVVPAGFLDLIDFETRKMRLALTTEQVRNSPAFAAETEDQPSGTYWDRLSTYYVGYFVGRLSGSRMVRAWFTSGISHD